MRRLVTAIVGALVLASAPSLGGQSSWADRVIDEDLEIRLPLAPCVVPAYAMRIARIIQQPAGAEFSPEACDWSTPRKFDEQISLRGLTAREAFDTLIEIDPRYRWVESEGVIVVRPLETWNDREHFLHRTIASFRGRSSSRNALLDGVLLHAPGTP
jgi:hypothetical protein